jgi:large subunit ribosomal protein L29
MKPKDIRELSVKEIEKKLSETRETLLQSNLRKHTGQVEKPHTFKAYRKDIARLETILTEKKQVAAAPAAAR